MSAVQVYLDEEELAASLDADARRGLTSTPKDLPPKWFYDERGSELFEAITGLEEYYPTRREREILVARAAEIAELSGASSLVELGSGSAAKTRVLLDAFASNGTLESYVPFDVCEEALRASRSAIGEEYPTIGVQGVVGDFERHLHLVPRRGRQLVAFLGGTIGNLVPGQRRRFLSRLRSSMRPGEHLLLGADLVKDPRRLVAAYDDAGGVTAEFNRNVLAVLNRQLGASFDPALFDHVARWVPEHEWIEMRLRSRQDHQVLVPALGLRVRFGRGEEMRTEISAKFRPEGLRRQLAEAGFDVVRLWTDEAGDFSLTLAAAGGLRGGPEAHVEDGVGPAPRPPGG
ncbi:MAG: L-histidine N(alpha)-methyltransferase [Acidimicrobiales bacterium]